VDLAEEYWHVMNAITRIPNRRFLALKAQHMRRIEQARMLDGAPAAFLWAIRLRLRLTDTRQALHAKPPAHADRDEPLAPESVAPPAGD